MKIVYEGGHAEIIEKKSRFIANVSKVSSEEEAMAFISDIKKQYWDARHNCSAFVIGDNGEISRSSDDGEPSGTAGRPILDAIVGMEATNVCVVVTRYFGGTLLGTGGLVRAYGGVTKKALEESKLAEVKTGYKVDVDASYDLEGKIKYLASTLGIIETDSEYAEKVKLSYMIEESLLASFESKLSEIASGKVAIKKSDLMSFAVCDGKVVQV